MDNKPALYSIADENLLFAFVPVLLLLAMQYRWRANPGQSCYAFLRMIVQLLLIGTVLSSIFTSDSFVPVVSVLALMLCAAAWIALRVVPDLRRQLYGYCFLAIFLGVGLVLLLITQWVLQLQPWYMPRYLIPLAGMAFAGAMNCVSIAVERFYAELAGGRTMRLSRQIALKAALNPLTNSLFAVGLVTLPGMMTGQILSGVPPHVAAKYQMMVMCLMYSAAGFSGMLFLQLITLNLKSPNH